MPCDSTLPLLFPFLDSALLLQLPYRPDHFWDSLLLLLQRFKGLVLFVCFSSKRCLSYCKQRNCWDPHEWHFGNMWLLKLFGYCFWGQSLGWYTSWASRGWFQLLFGSWLLLFHFVRGLIGLTQYCYRPSSFSDWVLKPCDSYWWLTRAACSLIVWLLVQNIVYAVFLIGSNDIVPL